jgi:hypothetical protein
LGACSRAQFSENDRSQGKGTDRERQIFNHDLTKWREIRHMISLSATLSLTSNLPIFSEAFRVLQEQAIPGQQLHPFRQYEGKKRFNRGEQ